MLNYKSIPEFVRLKYGQDPNRIKERAIRSYQICAHVPTYATAKELLDKLEVEYTQDSLLFSLELAKEKKLSTERYQESLLIKKCNVKANDCFKGMGYSLAEKDLLVSERIRETTKNGTQAEYVAKLIELDVNKRILPPFTEKEEN